MHINQKFSAAASEDPIAACQNGTHKYSLSSPRDDAVATAGLFGAVKILNNVQVQCLQQYAWDDHDWAGINSGIDIGICLSVSWQMAPAECDAGIF
ncbi:hypothetical protein ACLKA6_002116 [Drosophila palustris]